MKRLLLPREVAPLPLCSDRPVRRRIDAGELRIVQLTPQIRRVESSEPIKISTHVLSSRAVARLLRLHFYTVEAWAKRGVLPARRLRGQWAFRRTVLEAWIEERTSGLWPVSVPKKREIQQ